MTTSSSEVRGPMRLRQDRDGRYTGLGEQDNTPSDDGASAAEPQPEAFDAIVLGCGITGLVAASILAQQGYRRVLLVDEYGHIGGNHIDRTIGPYTFDVGSFVFQDDSPLLAYFPSLLPLYITIQPSWARLNPQGVVTSYPISVRDDIIGAGPLAWLRMASSVLVARLFHRRLRNAQDFARYWIGAYALKRTGLERYLERFYGVSPRRIDILFAQSRMLWIKEHGSAKRLLQLAAGVVRGADRRPVNQQLARPREGFTVLYQAAVDQLKAEGAVFRLGTALRSLSRRDQLFTLRTETATFTARKVISSIPVNSALHLCDLEHEDALQSMTLLSLFFSFRGQRRFTASILYNFSHEGAWKRLTVHSDFYGPADDREFFTVEMNADHVNGRVAEAEADFRDHVRDNGLFEGDLRLEGSYMLPNAYPIYTDGADARAERAITRLAGFGVESIGRQGGFAYQPTARVSALDAAQALARSAPL